MLQEKDKEYLARPLIEGMVFVIEDNNVRISSDNTIFIEVRRIKYIAKDEILTLYKNVLHKSKEQGVRISYSNHIRRRVHALWTEYEDNYYQVSDLFARITEQAKAVRERGIHIGANDDAELDKLSKIAWEHQRFLYRSGVISKISGILSSLEYIEKNMTASDCRITHIHL